MVTMIVVYKDEFWTYDCPVRESMFSDYKRLYGTSKILISKSGRTIEVKLNEVESQSIWRNK